MMRMSIRVTIVCVLLAPFLYAEEQTYFVWQKLSALSFDVSAQAHNVHGESRAFSGTITGDPADITSARIQIQLDPSTIDTGNDKRDKTMREKCLEVTDYPAIEFESTSITAASRQLVLNQPLDATVQGKLKLHGFEQEFVVPVRITWDGETLTTEGDMQLNLDHFKIERPRILFFKLQNLVKIHFKIGARKQQRG